MLWVQAVSLADYPRRVVTMVMRWSGRRWDGQDGGGVNHGTEA